MNLVVSVVGVCITACLIGIVHYRGPHWCGWWVLVRMAAMLDTWEAAKAVYRCKRKQYETEAGLIARKPESEEMIDGGVVWVEFTAEGTKMELRHAEKKRIETTAATTDRLGR